MHLDKSIVRSFSVLKMRYKCASCNTIKTLPRSMCSQTEYCITCKCRRSFEPDFSSTSTSLSSTRSSDASSHSSGNATRSSDMSSITPCKYFKLCLDYMLSLNLSKRLFDRSHNRCYCERCYGVERRDVVMQGDSRYVIPRGWVRFGLNVDGAQADVEDIWRKWVVTYHGTSPVAAKSILEHHQFLVPGDTCIGGSIIRIREGHIPGKFQVYTSPTIAYSGLDMYSHSTIFRSPSGHSSKAKIVLQCRQRPEFFRVQPETIGAGKTRICPHIPNSEVEYYTEVRSSIVPYGLLIRVFD
jgi:hypothetical protein